MKTFLTILSFLALAVGSAFMTQTVLDGPMTTPASVDKTFEPPLVLAQTLAPCEDLVECYQGCQAYPEPTQTQCENWCLHHYSC